MEGLALMELGYSKMHKMFSGPRGWFALSAYAFSTEPVGGKEGYTILRLAEETGGESKPEAGRYVLWELER